MLPRVSPARPQRRAPARPEKGAHMARRRPVWQGLVPQPDPGFVRKLKLFDPDLSVEFDRWLGKFCIYQTGRISGRTLAMVIQGGENSSGFRYPDERDLLHLKAVDMHNEHVRRKMIDDYEYNVHQDQEYDKRKAREEIRDATFDDKYQIKRAYRQMMNDGKASPHTRQVMPRPRGKVFK